tara:strand:- start:232 stop:693 length:462 start_codon:yes stop_codon:yes gene_type:complete
MITPVTRMIDCHIVCRNNNEIKYLLLKRSPNKIYPNIWQCVTGKIKDNEKAYQTAIREVHEETKLNAIKLWTVEHVNLFFEAQKNRINLIPVFGMEVNTKNVILSDEHTDYIWCDINLANEKILWNQQKIGLLTFHNMLQGTKEKLSFSEISL